MSLRTVVLMSLVLRCRRRRNEKYASLATEEALVLTPRPLSLLRTLVASLTLRDGSWLPSLGVSMASVSMELTSSELIGLQVKC